MIDFSLIVCVSPKRMNIENHAVKKIYNPMIETVITNSNNELVTSLSIIAIPTNC